MSARGYALYSVCPQLSFFLFCVWTVLWSWKKTTNLFETFFVSRGIVTVLTQFTQKPSEKLEKLREAWRSSGKLTDTNRQYVRAWRNRSTVYVTYPNTYPGSILPHFGGWMRPCREINNCTRKKHESVLIVILVALTTCFRCFDGCEESWETTCEKIDPFYYYINEAISKCESKLRTFKYFSKV